jgi:hypothetical protein
MVFAKPTVMVPKSMSLGLKVRTPSLPAPMISISYLTVYGTEEGRVLVDFMVLPPVLIKPDPGL